MAAENDRSDSLPVPSAIHPVYRALIDVVNAPDRFLTRHKQPLLIALTCGLPTVVAVFLIANAVRQHEIDDSRGAYLVLLVCTFMLNLAMFVSSMLDEKRIFVESHWGGLGGGLGGWRVSRSLVFLATTAATFALMAYALTERPVPDLRERYRAALNFAARQQMPCDDRGIVERRLVLRCTLPSGAIYNEFWNHIKLANTAHDDIVILRPTPTSAANGATDSANGGSASK